MGEIGAIYTIAEESKYVKVTGVAPYQLQTELEMRCRAFGRLTSIIALPCSDPITSTAFLLTFEDYLEAKKAKKALHKQSFYGFELCFRYQPVLETVTDTYNKLKLYEAHSRLQLYPPPRPIHETAPKEAVSPPILVKRRRI
jgi:hypothetical protein